MAEPGPQDRLHPFLLDRLTDEEPKQKEERLERRGQSTRRYRESVLRDMGWLLNAKSHSKADEINEYPEVAKSVLNFGMPDLAGITISSITPEEIERRVRNAILQYEPRIMRSSLHVSVVQSQADGGNVISLEIKGDIKLLPVPEPLYVRTKVDLETGHCELQE
jgi:type VI secretion system protein ImpF